MEFGIKEGVFLMVRRDPGCTSGDDDAWCEVRASDSTAMIKGLCLMANEAAKYLKMTKQELLCRLTVVLMGTDGKEEQL